jgi:hypothetical protein
MTLPPLPLNPLEVVLAELKALEVEKQRLDECIDALRQSARLLDAIYGAPAEAFEPLLDETFANSGITDAVRKVFASRTEERLSPTTVRDCLVAGGFDLNGRPNPMATIHTVLKRLVNGGELIPEKNEETTTYYCHWGEDTFERSRLRRQQEQEGAPRRPLPRRLFRPR